LRGGVQSSGGAEFRILEGRSSEFLRGGVQDSYGADEPYRGQLDSYLKRKELKRF